MVIPQAFNEPALLHSILAISSGTLKLNNDNPLNPSSASADLQFHKLASIHLINRKLQNVSDATQPSTILTIATLVAHEVSTPNPGRAQNAHNRTDS